MFKSGVPEGHCASHISYFAARSAQVVGVGVEHGVIPSGLYRLKKSPRDGARKLLRDGDALFGEIIHAVVLEVERYRVTEPVGLYCLNAVFGLFARPLDAAGVAEPVHPERDAEPGTLLRVLVELFVDVPLPVTRAEHGELYPARLNARPVDVPLMVGHINTFFHLILLSLSYGTSGGQPKAIYDMSYPHPAASLIETDCPFAAKDTFAPASPF